MDAAQFFATGRRRGQQALTELSQTAREQARNVNAKVRDHRTRGSVTSPGSGVDSDMPPPVREHTHALEEREGPQTASAGEVEITLARQGGRTAVTVTGFTAANARLHVWAGAAPGGWACEYSVRFPDGALAEGSIPLTPDADLREHVRRNWQFLAGLDPRWATPEEYARVLAANEKRRPGMTEHYRELLERHRLS